MIYTLSEEEIRQICFEYVVNRYEGLEPGKSYVGKVNVRVFEPDFIVTIEVSDIKEKEESNEPGN